MICLARLVIMLFSVVRWGPENVIFFGAVFWSRFWASRVRPNCLASPLWPKIVTRKWSLFWGPQVGGCILNLESGPAFWSQILVLLLGSVWGLVASFDLWAEMWSPSGVDPLVSLRPLPGYESSSFLAAQAALFSACLIRSRPMYGSWLVE